MDFIEAKNAAAREIALALGVPPMLLGIPGDNTYSSYQEANRSFWRQTVLPLVARTAKAVSAWLAPAYGALPAAGRQSLELRPDLDQVEALAPEREALWARIERVSFLTLNEKRQAVGYAPVEESAAPTTPENGEAVVVRKYNPDQARAPAGQSDGGQWVDEGGGSGDLGSGSEGSAPEDRVRVAQAEGIDSGRYSPSKSGWHDYGTENEVCPAEWECSTEEMSDQLSRFAFPGQDATRPVSNESINLVIDLATGIEAGHVRTKVLDDGLLVVNITLPDHILHDGQVERRAVRKRDGSWSVVSRGVGNNVTRGMNLLNNLVGPKVFRTLDQRLRENIGTHHGKKSLDSARLRHGHRSGDCGRMGQGDCDV